MKQSFIKHLFTLWVLTAFLPTAAFSQSVTFDFSGMMLHKETAMEIDSVHIFNITNGSDTLVIGNTFSTTITSIDDPESGRKNVLMSYPNPFNREVYITFYSNYNESAKIALYALDGKRLSEWDNIIHTGENNFRLKSGKQGVLFLTIVSKNISLNSKLICVKASGKSEINRISYFSDNRINLLKSAVLSSSFDFSLGDSLNFLGYSGSIESALIAYRPSGDKSYTFVFDVSAYVPLAAFEVSSQKVNLGNSINFFDQSTNSPDSWTWDFGDGSSSNDQDPTHTYLQPGIYTVTLISGNDYGTDTIVKQNYIEVGLLRPQADFYADTTTVNQGENVNFVDQSTNGPDTWNWDFGDGDTSTVQNPSHTYSEAGTFTVSLIVGNSFGADTLTQTNYITVNSMAPMAEFSASVSKIITGEQVDFTDESSNTPTSWTWDFGDGETSSDQNPSHIYNAAGLYSIQLMVSNEFGSDSITKTDFIEVLAANEPMLAIHPTVMDFDTASIQMIFTISNSGTGVLTWAISEELDWLTITQLSGETSTGTEEIRVTVNRNELSPGDYSGLISISSNGGDEVVTVNMKVQENGIKLDTPVEPGWN